MTRWTVTRHYLGLPQGHHENSAQAADAARELREISGLTDQQIWGKGLFVEIIPSERQVRYSVDVP